MNRIFRFLLNFLGEIALLIIGLNCMRKRMSVYFWLKRAIECIWLLLCIFFSFGNASLFPSWKKFGGVKLDVVYFLISSDVIRSFLAFYLGFFRGYVGIHSSGFRDFLLKPELLRAIVDSGFEHPSEGKLSASLLLVIFCCLVSYW